MKTKAIYLVMAMGLIILLAGLFGIYGDWYAGWLPPKVFYGLCHLALIFGPLLVSTPFLVNFYRINISLIDQNRIAECDNKKLR